MKNLCSPDLSIQEFFGHLLCIAALALTRLLDLDGQELCSDGLGLLLHNSARVKHAHDCAHVFGGACGRQPSHAATNDQNLGRRHAPSCSDLPGEETREDAGSLDHSPACSKHMISWTGVIWSNGSALWQRWSESIRVLSWAWRSVVRSMRAPVACNIGHGRQRVERLRPTAHLNCFSVL